MKFFDHLYTNRIRLSDSMDNICRTVCDNLMSSIISVEILFVLETFFQFTWNSNYHTLSDYERNAFLGENSEKLGLEG